MFVIGKGMFLWLYENVFQSISVRNKPKEEGNGKESRKLWLKQTQNSMRCNCYVGHLFPMRSAFTSEIEKQ